VAAGSEDQTPTAEEGTTMSIDEGHFRLYTHVVPALKAGDYRFATTQSLTAKDKDGDVPADRLPVEELHTHLRVTSPRYQLPPDQILSTYPPAGTEGAYGSRLPQVVIKRRTLPWERSVEGGDDGTPWLALVVFAEGEADLLTNVPVGECVTAGVRLDGPVDIEKGSCLEIRTSMVRKIMPTRKDVPLLAHAREVNINDTELMMGDDDGFLAVVIANRLPLAARNPNGTEAPVKYHAALVNLEGQFTTLLPESPPAVLLTDHMVLQAATALYSPAEYDHMTMDVKHAGGSSVMGGVLPHGDAPEADAMAATATRSRLSEDLVTKANRGSGAWSRTAETSPALELFGGTSDLGYMVGSVAQFVDPKLRFPVLVQWTFTSVGEMTFELLMREADSGLLGTIGEHPKQAVGRKPLEVVETGHVGLDQRTRRGDLVRAWYRGPLLPHPADTTSPRLPLAHTGDQLRAVIPDGREDLSLAAAFEIGRLLALSQPSMVASLLRWRQIGYQAARGKALWDGILDGLDLEQMLLEPGKLLGTSFGRGLAQAIGKNPGDTIGPPREIMTAGTPMNFDGDPVTLVTKGFGIDLATDVPLVSFLDALRGVDVPRMPLADLSKAAATKALTGALNQVMDASLVQLASGALSTQIMTTPGGVAGGVVGGVDVVAGGLGGIFGGVSVGMPHSAGMDEGAPDALDLALQGRASVDEEDKS